MPRNPGGGVAIEDAFPPERLATGQGYDLVVATIVATDGVVATNAKPPRLTLRIDEVLAGAVERGEVQAVWAPPPHGVDWSGPGADAALAAWGGRSLEAPPVGAKLIVLGRRGGAEGYRVLSRLREPFSAERRTYWSEAIAKARKQREVIGDAAAAARAKKAADEARRLEEADPAALAAKAQIVLVGKMETLRIDRNGHHVRLVVKEVLTPEHNPPPVPPARTMYLFGPEEEARFDAEREVLVFLAPRRWESPLGGEIDGLRIVDPRTGVLPATPDFVLRARAALRDRLP